MSEIAGSVAESLIIQPLIASIKDKLKYIWSYGTYVKDLKDELNHLQDAKERLQKQVDTSIYNGQKIHGDVSRWMEEAEKITKEALEVIGKHNNSKKGCCRGVIPNPSTRYLIASEADGCKQEIGKLQQRDNFATVSHPHAPEGVVTGEYKGPEYWIAPSRKLLLEDIGKTLSDAKVRMVGICGASGVGKSVFLKQLEKHIKEKKLNFDFDAVVMAVVSRSPNWEKVQDDLGYGSCSFEEFVEASQVCYPSYLLVILNFS